MRAAIRFLFAAALALSALASSAATFVPVNLLNPAGSTSGQAIVSAGSATAPAWANVTASGLTAVAANTVIANVTGSAASPTAFAMPTCTGPTRPVTWSAGTGFTCFSNVALTTGNLSQFVATTSAQFAGVISDETGTGAVVFGSSPTLNTPNIVGATNGSNAAAGSVGEYVTNSATGVAVTSAGATVNVTSISLTAGDWDVVGISSLAGATTTTAVGGGISTTSATFGALGSFSSVPGTASTPTVRISISATTTVFLVGNATFTGTATLGGLIRARRIR